MSSLAALILATPLFGLQLHAPLAQPGVFFAPYDVIDVHAGLPLPELLQTRRGRRAGRRVRAERRAPETEEVEVEADEPEQDDDSGASWDEPSVDRDDAEEAERDEAEEEDEDVAPARRRTRQPPDDDDEDRAENPDDYAARVRLRQELTPIHRALGIVTWASMTVTAALGMIQYYNLYGFGAGIGDNPCVSGDAVFGQDQCWGTPWPHAISASITTTLYSVTLALSIGLLLNDPNEVLSGPGAFSDKMRAHSVLAIIHLAGMIAQTFIGIGLANSWFGNRADNYSDLQTVGTIHQVIGWTTWAALGAAGALMLF